MNITKKTNKLGADKAKLLRKKVSTVFSAYFKSNSISNNYFSEVLDVNPSTGSRILNGKNSIRLEDVLHVAKKMNLKITINEKGITIE